MTTVNIGNKIRELRRKKGMTQEALASALSVSPQAVSKWESGLTYPDMTMIPVIAGYFEISLDILFGYDVGEMKSKIQQIIDGARKYFFDDTEKYIGIIQDVLKEYPGNEALLSALLDAYEYDLRNNDNTAHLDEIIEISQRIISESTDFVGVCSVKEDQAAAYLKMGEYDKAKAVIETLPIDVNLKYDTIAFRLKGKDKLNGAVLSRCSHLQSLYQACFEEGNAWLFMEETGDTFSDYTPDEYVPNAMKAYRQGLTVLTAFINDEYEGEDRYLWSGMQTFHWSFHQCIAACYKRLGQIDRCAAEIDIAYGIISTAWDDFDENREGYMKYFNEYLADLGLEEYAR